MRDFWTYRELVRNLTVVDLKNRYQNTALGFLWSLLSPLLLALVLYFVFRYLYGQGPEFPRYLLVGLMTYRFFSTGTTQAIYSIVGKGSLVTRIYIPRKILVFSSALANLISTFLEFIVIIPIIWALGGLPATTIFFPLVFLIYFWFVYGISLLLAALYVYFRDVNQIWDVLTNVLFFLSPIIYPMIQISDKTMPFYLLNPLTEFIIIFRNLMIYGIPPTLYGIAIIVVASAGAFIIGNLVFDRLQRRFAEAM